MAIRLSGMASGLDTDAMITELVSAYSTKKDSIYKEQKSLEYKQDAWKTLNTSVYGFYTGTLGNMRFSSGYAIKATSASNTSKVTVSASNSAVNGTQELKITSLAKTGYLTGAKLGGGIKGSTTLKELGITGSSRLSVTTDGKTSNIDIDENLTVDKFVAKLKDAGLQANFDENNQRFFISAKESGADADFSLSGTSASANEALKALGLYSVSKADIDSYKAYIADEANIENKSKNEYLNNLLNAEKTTLNQDIIKLKEKIASENNVIDFAKKSDEDKTKTIDELQKKIDDINKQLNPTTDEEKEKASALTEGDKELLEAKLKEYNDLKATYDIIKTKVGSSEAEGFDDKVKEYTDEHQAVIDGYTADIEAKEEEIKKIDETIAGDITGKETYLGADKFDYQSAEYTKILQAAQDRLAYSKEMVADYEAYEAALEANDTAAIAQYEQKLGISSSADGAVRITGADAEIYLNGARFTSTTNSFNINGLNITAMGLTDPDETISVTTSDDVDGIYDKIKSLIKGYNDIMKEMSTSYYAESAGDYKPLTDEEMGEMTDKQIEKWEDKLTTAALRKDSTLGGVISALKVAMSKSFDVDGESFSLSTFGIKTAGYFSASEAERGIFHIDGDADDKTSSGNTDKLKAAIASDPDKVISFFSQLSQEVYNKLSDKMKSSSMSSAYTLYNDKSMKKEYDKYDEKLEEWEDKIAAMEEKYVKQFSAMEKALATLQSQQSQLSGLLGM